MHIRLFFTTILLGCAALYAQSQSVAFEWAVSMGGDDFDVGASIVTDAGGNSYVVGYFEDTVDFDPGPGTALHIAGYYPDVFIQKLDAAGDLLWIKTVGGDSWDYGISITLDMLDNVYVTGLFMDSVDFDPGPGTAYLTSHGETDIFVLKLDASGNYVWAKSIGGLDFDGGLSISTDDSGSVYVAGVFEGVVDFDPGSGTAYLTSVGSEAGYILKLDNSGDFLWVKHMVGASARSISVNATGHVSVTGDFSGTAYIDPGPSTITLSSQGLSDIFALRLDATGTILWAKAMGGISRDYAYSIFTDAWGNMLVTGSFSQTVDFDPGPDTSMLTSHGQEDIFVLNLNSSGNLVWAKSIGGMDWDEGRSIYADETGQVFVTGHFNDTVDFDPGPGTYSLDASQSHGDIFLLKLDALGNLGWAKSLAGTSTTHLAYGYGLSITTDTSENVYATGYFEGTFDFDPGPGITTLTSHWGGDDIFVLKLSPCTPTSDTLNQAACISYTSPSGNHTWTASGTYTDILYNATGCDSILTINLAINPVDTAVTQSGATLTASATGATYQWLDCDNGYATIPGETQTTFTPQVDGSYALEVNQNGCVDTSGCYSVCIPSTSTIDLLVCYDYTSPSGNFFWTESGTYFDTLSNAVGCDSIITINLTIPVVDTTVIQSGATLTATATEATFQWYDCNTGSWITGATQASFTPQVNGIYAVSISQNGCSDSSACISVTNVSIARNDFGEALQAYPNPTTGRISIDLGQTYRDINLTIRNLHGQLIQAIHPGTASRLNVEVEGPQGIYLIEIRSEDKAAVLKVIKE